MNRTQTYQKGYISAKIQGTSSEPVKFDDFSIQLKSLYSAKLYQENHYYPFGMNMKGLESSDKQSTQNKKEHEFQFNAQTEREEEFGLFWDETPFRNYDSQLGRLWGVDKLSEATYGLTPFHYSMNNPISGNDPTGLFTSLANEKEKMFTTAGQQSTKEAHASLGIVEVKLQADNTGAKGLIDAAVEATEVGTNSIFTNNNDGTFTQHTQRPEPIELFDNPNIVEELIQHFEYIANGEGPHHLKQVVKSFVKPAGKEKKGFFRDWIEGFFGGSMGNPMVKGTEKLKDGEGYVEYGIRVAAWTGTTPDETRWKEHKWNGNLEYQGFRVLERYGGGDTGKFQVYQLYVTGYHGAVRLFLNFTNKETAIKVHERITSNGD